MYTYQDLQRVRDDERDRMDFVHAVIMAHKDTELYKTAVVAQEYDAHRNKTIVEYQKLLYTVTGKAVPDNFSANFKLASRFFNRFITQENQYLLGNGATWENEETEKKLGEDFDIQLQKLGRYALVGGVSFGFYNLDHVDAFPVTEFAPLYDEENGALMAGVRFWQVDDTKPLRATFYEIDGYTEYIWNKKVNKNGSYTLENEVLQPKRKYKLKTRTTAVDGTEIYDGENYPGFPIVPLWGNPNKQSELVGIREQIDCYDLIKSGYANNVDEGSMIYWTIQNAGGMDDMDLQQFIERMKTLKAAALGAGQVAESHTLEAPYQSREAILATLRADLYEDAMALDTKNIANGAITATQIKAAYEPLNSKCDQYEYCVLEFISGLLKVAGISDTPTFTRSMIVNNQEELQLLLMSAQYLTGDYVTEKILNIFGDGDKAEEMLEQKAADELAMANIGNQAIMTEEVTEEETA